jgi:hypothetical protein
VVGNLVGEGQVQLGVATPSVRAPVLARRGAERMSGRPEVVAHTMPAATSTTTGSTNTLRGNVPSIGVRTPEYRAGLHELDALVSDLRDLRPCRQGRRSTTLRLHR